MTEVTERKPTQECLDKEIPIKLSMAGYNAYYHHCELYHGRSSYAVCQHTIDAVLEQRVTLRSECQNAIESGLCPAMKMRKEEAAAGRALFFTDRRERMAELNARLKEPSTVIRYGKPKVAPEALKTVAADEKAQEKFRLMTQRVKPEPKPENPDELNAELVGRNLLGEAVNSMMNKGA